MKRFAAAFVAAMLPFAAIAQERRAIPIKGPNAGEALQKEMDAIKYQEFGLLPGPGDLTLFMHKIFNSLDPDDVKRYQDQASGYTTRYLFQIGEFYVKVGDEVLKEGDKVPGVRGWNGLISEETKGSTACLTGVFKATRDSDRKDLETTKTICWDRGGNQASLLPMILKTVKLSSGAMMFQWIPLADRTAVYTITPGESTELACVSGAAPKP